ncbi:SRPBCC family protein [Phenylobacterium sp. LH3H17]|uniref:SRPBCC family protein n=1 Tax=Phenylobacterium sp. LH3H17 TaxID=2903901 RepID=UPI0020C9B0AA|nr:SRPBCC family protein [Phenylobacterium sp. LH3H17]UTP38017.1 SRPBCC family protein [Phenylobacterium sp. LH3H17]
MTTDLKTRPDTFRVERSIQIAAAPETVLALIEDFRNWTRWSPYEKMDADLKRSYSGASAGVGAVYGWEGKKTGVGRMAITRADPSQVLIDLDFVKPMKANNKAVFTLEPQGGGTKVTWAMTGANTFMSKVMGLFFSMDRLLGGQFENGLADLKTAAEGRA